VRRSLAHEREASTEAGPADRYGTPVVRNQNKPPLTAAEKHEKTVNALRTGLGKYWEGHGNGKSYEAGKGKGRDDSEPECTSDTLAQAGAATDERDEEEDEDVEQFFEPDLVFMVNNRPNTIEEALSGAEKDHWIEAINTELDSLEDHATWGVITLGGLPTEVRPICSRMALQENVGEDGRVACYKARLVGHGFCQRPGINFGDMFAPTILYATIRVVLSKAAEEDKEITQLDIVTAFLESQIEEELYLKLPKHFTMAKDGRVELKMEGPGGKRSKPDSEIVVRLKRSFYGLKQAGHNCYHTPKSHFIERMKMKPSLYEAGIYITKTGATIITWVDDLLLIGTKGEVVEMKKQIRERFQIKDLGNVKFFLSMLVERDRETRTMFLSQQTYLTQILDRFSLDHCKGCSTPLDPKTKLHLRTEVEESTEIQTYQEAVGCLRYAAIMTRPDIPYTAGLMGRFSDNPSTLQWQAVKRILRYIQATKGYRLLLGAGKEEISSEQSTIQALKVYAGADFARRLME